MKKLVILTALAAATIATIVPAEALVIGVGGRGVGVRVGARPFVRRGPVIRRPFVRRGFVGRRGYRRF